MIHGEDKDKLAGSGGAILTRRNLLELAGLAFAATVIPSGVAAAASEDEAAQGVSPVMDKLSKYMSEAEAVKEGDRAAKGGE